MEGIAEPKTGTGYPMNSHPVVNRAPNPTNEEPFCVVRDNIISEMLVHDAERLANPQDVLNRVVFDCIEPNPSAFRSASATPAPQSELPPYYSKAGESDTTVSFESRFECGNLRRAIQVYEYEYDLILRPDINTRGHTQWYYFRCRNMMPGRAYKFNIINLTKPDSLYNYGMRPLVYSDTEANADGIGWQRRGEDICYYQNHIKRRQGSYYTLTFTLHTKYADDTVHIAYCYPYSFTDLQVYLHELESDPKRRNRFRRRTLCQTLAGNNCDLLTITSFACDPEALKARKGVVISGRVHPGESNASWMMKGFIDYLTGPSLDAKILRDNFVFKIVPMLNPDGVINGNYRCSLAGCDLNRQWLDPSKKINPTIFSTKMMMKRFMEDREVVMFCDLHGHSRKKNIFMYGCDQAENSAHRLKERIFPRLLAKNSDIFSFADCNFKVQKSKEGCGRVVVARELGLLYSYTMEASFCGANFGRQSDCHFNSYDLEQMGHYFCDTILDFCDPDQSKVNAIRAELDIMYPPKKERNKPKAVEDDSGDTSSDDVSDSGSDSGDEGKKKKKVKKKIARRRKDPDAKAPASRKTTSAGGGSGGSATDSSTRVPGHRMHDRQFKDALGKFPTRGSAKRSAQAGTPKKKGGGTQAALNSRGSMSAEDDADRRQTGSQQRQTGLHMNIASLNFGPGEDGASSAQENHLPRIS
jgi:hypothetical protein|eukprot:COSAG01_NODE_1181_length_11357_cov_130.760082_2_plen_698_part_00